jgi:hypothetical protein
MLGDRDPPPKKEKKKRKYEDEDDKYVSEQIQITVHQSSNLNPFGCI